MPHQDRGSPAGYSGGRDCERFSVGAERGCHAHTRTESDGSFAITAPSAGTYRLLTSIDGCSVYFRRGGSVTSQEQATRITVDERDVTGVRFQLREGQCRTKIAGRLLDANGDAIADADVWARHEDNLTVHAKTGGDGSFSITTPQAGVYRLQASIDNCWVFFRRGGAVTSREQATRITIDERDATGILFQLREGQCTTRIAGRLLDAEGNPLASTQVSAVPENGSWSSTQTESDGSFSITVPGAGQYRVNTRNRWLHGLLQTQRRDRLVSAGDADSGIRFRCDWRPFATC